MRHLRHDDYAIVSLAENAGFGIEKLHLSKRIGNRSKRNIFTRECWRGENLVGAANFTAQDKTRAFVSNQADVRGDAKLRLFGKSGRDDFAGIDEHAERGAADLRNTIVPMRPASAGETLPRWRSSISRTRRRIPALLFDRPP